MDIYIFQPNEKLNSLNLTFQVMKFMIMVCKHAFVVVTCLNSQDWLEREGFNQNRTFIFYKTDK